MHRTVIRACAVAAAIAITQPSRANPDVQDPASIAAAASAAAVAAARDADLAAPPAVRIDAIPRLAACSLPLRGVAAGYRPGAAQLSVRVVCDGSPSWRVWVPVRLAVRVPMVVVRRDLARGALLTQGDLDIVDRIPDGRGRWASDPAALVGRRLRQGLAAGSPVQTSMTTADRLVVRGQQVTLETAAGAIRVTARGIAKSDGGLGARVRVQSISSSRVVEGVVRSSEVVEVLLPGSGSG